MIPYNQSTYDRYDLEKDLADFLQPVDIHRVISAYDLAEEVHRDQTRNDESPYFYHCARVCKILVKEMQVQDPDMLIAGLTHDVLEDSPTLTQEVLAYNFGEYPAFIVQILTKNLEEQKNDPDAFEKAHIALLEKSPLDCLIIKLSARLDNFRCLDFHLKRNPLVYVNRTTELYLPLADSSKHPVLLKLSEELKKERNKYLG
ncbi:MAG: HD domain-containing protein [Candidatus Kapaibacteriota bacterium]|jgi:guanosine-3',5'-bis(diphosphate) 3'-pyrophosphohydrolase